MNADEREAINRREIERIFDQLVTAIRVRIGRLKISQILQIADLLGGNCGEIAKSLRVRLRNRGLTEFSDALVVSPDSFTKYETRILDKLSEKIFNPEMWCEKHARRR